MEANSPALALAMTLALALAMALALALMMRSRDCYILAPPSSMVVGVEPGVGEPGGHHRGSVDGWDAGWLQSMTIVVHSISTLQLLSSSPGSSCSPRDFNLTSIGHLIPTLPPSSR